MTRPEEAKPAPLSNFGNLWQSCPLPLPIHPISSHVIPFWRVLAPGPFQGIPSHLWLKASAEGRNSKNTKRNGNLRCAEVHCCRKYQLPSTCFSHPTLYPSRSHARTSSSAPVTALHDPLLNSGTCFWYMARTIDSYQAAHLSSDLFWTACRCRGAGILTERTFRYR